MTNVSLLLNRCIPRCLHKKTRISSLLDLVSNNGKTFWLCIENLSAKQPKWFGHANESIRHTQIWIHEQSSSKRIRVIEVFLIKNLCQKTRKRTNINMVCQIIFFQKKTKHEERGCLKFGNRFIFTSGTTQCNCRHYGSRALKRIQVHRAYYRLTKGGKFTTRFLYLNLLKTVTKTNSKQPIQKQS